MGSALLGVGHFLPAEIEVVGVRRPMAAEAVGPSTLAVRAAAGALAQAGIDPEAVQFIVFATMTPDVTFPGAGCFLQQQLGCGTVGALDVRAQCAGFLFGLVVADRFVRAGAYERVLLAAGEVHSAGLDYSEAGAHVAALYGDGAGVAIIGRGAAGAGLRGAALHTDGRHHREFWCEYPASRQHPVRMTVEDFRRGRHYLQLDVDAVRRFADEALPAAIDEALRDAGIGAQAVDRFIIAHVLPDVADRVGARLGVSADRLSNPSARHGHLSAAALPVALSEDLARGIVGRGATVCLAACGAGFAWGAAVLTL